MPIQWTTDSKGNRTATWVDDEPAAPKAQTKSSVSAPGSGLLDVITKDAPVLLEGSAKGLTKGIETLQKTGDVGRALGAAGRAYVDTVEQSNNPIPRVVLGGARDLVQNTLGNMPADVGSLLTNKPRLQNAPDAPILGVIPPLPKVKLQGPGEELASNIVQFALGWVPAAGAIGLAGRLATKVPGIAQGVQAARTTGAFLKGNKVAGAVLKGGEIVTKGAVTGSVVDFAAMDASGGRLTDAVVQLNPTIRKFTEQTIGTPLELPYLEYLRSKPGDKAAEARWKNAIEGNFFVGPAFETVMWAAGRFARASSQYLQTIGQPKARPVVDVTAEAVPAAPVPKASKAEVAAAEVELRQAATDLEEATAKLATPEPPAPVAAAAPQEIPTVPIGQVVDEAVPAQIFHGTTKANATAIRESGFQASGPRGDVGNALGDGVFFTSNPQYAKDYGPEVLGGNPAAAGIRLKTLSNLEYEELITSKYGGFDQYDFPRDQQALIKEFGKEFDGVRVTEGFGGPGNNVGDEIVIFDPKKADALISGQQAPAAAAPTPTGPLLRPGAELYHGTTAEGRKGIMANGFRVSEAEKAGTVLGEGVYFAGNERYAAAYGGKSAWGQLPDDAKILDLLAQGKTVGDLADEIGVTGPRKTYGEDVRLSYEQQQQVKDWALANGYDGIRYRSFDTPDKPELETVIYNVDLANRLVGSKAAAAAPEPSVPSAGTSAPAAPAAGPTPREIQELDQALAMSRADLSPDKRVALRNEILAKEYGTGSPAEPPAPVAMADEAVEPPATVIDDGGDVPPVEPPRFTSEDESPDWVLKFAQQVAENLDDIKAGRVQMEDLLANNFQKFQSPSGNTKYVAQQPDLVAGYDAMSQVLPDRDVMSGIPTFNKKELEQLNQEWFYRYGEDGEEILKGLAPVIKGFEEYQLGALHRAMVLADKKNMEAAMEGAMWVNSAGFDGVNVTERLSRLVEAAAAAKRVNLAVMKVTRPWGQLGLEMQMNRDLVVPKTGNPDAPLVDIAAELRRNLEEGQDETLEETLLGKFHPDLATAVKGGDITPEAQSAADALAEVLQDIHVDKKAAPRFWETLDGLESNSAVETILSLRTNNLISSGITMATNVMNGVFNMPVLTAQQVFGRGLKGDWRGAMNDVAMFQQFWMQLSGGFRMFGHAFKTGRSLTNLDRSTIDGLSKLAQKDAFEEAALEPKRSTSMINSFPLISEDLANTQIGKMADWMWRVLGTPFSRLAVSIDTFNATVSGYAYEHVRHLPRGMELALERGMKEGSPEAYKWAQQYADARLKESVKSVVVDGRTLGEAALDSPHAKTFMDAVNFTDKLMAELQPRTPAEGIRLGQAEGLKGDELQAFAEKYVQEGTTIQKMAKLMLEGPVPLGRTASVVPAGMTALAKAQYVGPIFRFIQPFITVPNNIMKTVARNSPAAPLVDTWWRDMSSEDPGTRARALGQWTTGSAFLAFITLQMQLGNVRFNGNPPLDPRARDEWLNIQKRVPNSIQIPDGQGGWLESISTRAFEPFSTLMGAIGEYSDLAGSMSDQEREKLGGALVWTVLTLQARNLLGKSYFQGANELYEAIFGAGQNDTGSKALERWQRYIARQVTTMLPGISALRAARRTTDPIARTTDVVDPDEVGGIVNAIFYQALDELRISIPGQSEQSPARLHPITGRPIVLSGIWGTEFIPEDQPWLAALAQYAPWSPLQVGERVTDPVDMEMGRLSQMGTSFSLPQASDFGAGMRLSRSQLNQYIETFASVKILNRTVHERLTEAVQSELYQSWPYEPKDSNVPSLRAGFLQEIISEYKEVAKQQFLNTSAIGGKITREKAEIDRYKAVQDFTRRYGGVTAPRQPEGLR